MSKIFKPHAHLQNTNSTHAKFQKDFNKNVGEIVLKVSTLFILHVGK